MIVSSDILIQYNNINTLAIEWKNITVSDWHNENKGDNYAHKLDTGWGFFWSLPHGLYLCLLGFAGVAYCRSLQNDRVAYHTINFSYTVLTPLRCVAETSSILSVLLMIWLVKVVDSNSRQPELYNT